MGGDDQSAAGDGEYTIVWERFDARAGIIDTIKIPRSALWARPMSKSEIAAKLDIDRSTISAWIGNGQIEAEPCGSRWRVRPDIFGGREQIEQLAAAAIESR